MDRDTEERLDFARETGAEKADIVQGTEMTVAEVYAWRKANNAGPVKVLGDPKTRAVRGVTWKRTEDHEAFLAFCRTRIK
jgi:hypothetical protein